MTDAKSPRPRRKASKNTFTTKSGKTIQVNRTLGDRLRISREAKAQRKAAYLSTLPKEPWKRLLYRLHPKRLYKYWFSRDGLVMALKLAGIGVVVLFVLTVGLFAYFRKDLPKINDINSTANSGGSIAYYDRTGTVLLFQDYGEFKRIPVGSTQISKYMKEATIAIEDKDFYHEGAFNVKGILRAAVNNATGGSTQGGSTITEQLVKLNENWTTSRTVSNKIKELILAVEVEREYNKDDILTAYLNLAPYSGLDEGVEAAAEDLFHTDAAHLSLAQAALLAAIPKNPNYLSPYASPQFNPSATDNLFDQQGLINRQQYILDQMAKQGYITQAQANDAKGIDILGKQVYQMPTSHYAGMKPGYAYAVLSAKEELNKDFPASFIKAGGWKVTTTIDVNLQNLANKSLSDNAKKIYADKADDASFAAEDNATGQVVALVGGMDFNSQQLNFASSAPISPGSSIKPYSYATLINDNNNVGAGSMLSNTLGPLPGYPCGNKATPEAQPNNPSPCLFNDVRSMHDGNVTLRYALGSSLNIPAVKAFTSTNPKDTSVCTAATTGSCRRLSINTTMSTINAMMDNPDGYKCYTPGTVISSADKSDEVPCGAAAGIGNEAYTTLVDHVNGLATLARMGQAIPPTFIIKVTNASGKSLPLPAQPKPKQVINQDAAYIVNNMAADPGASYLGVYGHACATTAFSCDSRSYEFHRYKGWQNAIKTGTNQDLDGLMMSWNTRYTAGVWIGNYNRSPYGGTPEKVTDPIMKAWMQGAIDSLGNAKPVNWVQPNDIKTLPAYHSIVPFKSEATPPANDLFPSWYVGKSSGSQQAIDKVSGKLATSCTPDLAKQTGDAAGALWNVDIYNGGSPSTSSGTTSTANQPTDDVHACSDSDHMPSATITAVNGVSPGGSSLTCPSSGCTIMVHVEQGIHPLTDPTYPQFPGTLSLVVNGQTVTSEEVDTSGDYPLTFTPPAGSSGSIQVEASVTDSVLYQGTDTQTVIVSGGSAFRGPTNSGKGAGKGKDKLALSALQLSH
ncbi:MAG TPA: transglycosylase domain-containing protein [Candidatus Saccharimonadales bacterium]|nr:transglycosylase domain-containing protein [Candidatus Saccharimonadales bacterium]